MSDAVPVEDKTALRVFFVCCWFFVFFVCVFFFFFFFFFVCLFLLLFIVNTLLKLSGHMFSWTPSLISYNSFLLL